jgi:hypothetical protein
MENKVIQKFLKRRKQWKELYPADYVAKFFMLYDGEIEAIENALTELAERQEPKGFSQKPCPVCGEKGCKRRNSLLHKNYG